jgi:ribonuclease P protein component
LNVSEQGSTEPKQNKADTSLPRVTYRFGKHHRLLTAAEYSVVFNDAPFRASHPNFLILARTNAVPQAKLGLVISKKNVRHAVNRNRIKRVARETFRLQQHNLPTIDAIVLARRGADTVPHDQLAVIFNGLWKRIIKKACTESASGSEQD